MRFELWATDLFDREAAPSQAGTFATLELGLEALWRATLDEGIQDDGRPTFTWFTLRGPPTSLSLPRDPFSNLHLAMLRQRWKQTPSFAATLARLHATLLEGTLSLEQLVLSTTELPELLQQATRVLAGHLRLSGALTLKPSGRWELATLHVSATWKAPEPEYRLEGHGLVVRCVGERLTVEASDDSARVLADVLFEAGVPLSWSPASAR